jgi:hypothetical protein
MRPEAMKEIHKHILYLFNYNFSNAQENLFRNMCVEEINCALLSLFQSTVLNCFIRNQVWLQYYGYAFTLSYI